MKVLVVEDDASIAKLYQVELTMKGYEVEVAPDGEEGIAKAKQWQPDIVLLDIMMPKINGLDVLKALKADQSTSHIKVMMLTNFGQENFVKEAFSSGADDYVLKYQSTPAEVAEKVQALLSPA